MGSAWVLAGFESHLSCAVSAIATRAEVELKKSLRAHQRRLSGGGGQKGTDQEFQAGKNSRKEDSEVGVTLITCAGSKVRQHTPEAPGCGAGRGQ